MSAPALRRAYRIARHFGERHVGDFLASLSPKEYQYLEWSFTFDPPAEDRLDLILSRIEWRLAYLFGGEDAVPFGEFRARWDDLEPADGSADEAQPDGAAAEVVDAELLAAWRAKDAMRATLGLGPERTFAPLVPRPTGALPPDLFAMMTGGGDAQTPNP